MILGIASSWKTSCNVKPTFSAIVPLVFTREFPHKTQRRSTAPELRGKHWKLTVPSPPGCPGNHRDVVSSSMVEATNIGKWWKMDGWMKNHHFGSRLFSAMPSLVAWISTFGCSDLHFWVGSAWDYMIALQPVHLLCLPIVCVFFSYWKVQNENMCLTCVWVSIPIDKCLGLSLSRMFKLWRRARWPSCF